ncbi:MAG: class I SAM-dependent methyltransferase [Deltaproteobacteria bacterium]|nr:class I SAM-dependent methyltransferase [Deltaproteobacteria bacterium]
MSQSPTPAFPDRLLDILNSASLALMLSIGHRARLFDVMAEMDWATCEEISRRAEKNERYVREWLGAVTVGRILEYDPATRRYRLPADHAAVLTRKAAPNNIAPFFQYIPMMGSVEDRILDCFDKGGGVPYEAFARFHDVMAEDSEQTVVSALEDHVLPLVPELAVRLREGIDALDVGCGRGRALLRLAELFPKSRFTGYDLSETAVSRAREEASQRGLKNLRFAAKDLTEWREGPNYDLITALDAIHDQKAPDRVLSAIHSALRPGGIFLMQDIRASSRLENNLDHPSAPFLYTVSCLHCMTVSLAQDGAGLGAVWGEEKAREMLAAAGFTEVRVHNLAHDFQNSFFVVKKP